MKQSNPKLTKINYIAQVSKEPSWTKWNEIDQSYWYPVKRNEAK